MMRAGHLVVDLGGVLCDFEHGRRLDRLAQICDLTAEQIDARVWGSGFSADCDRGRYGSAAEVRARIRAMLAVRGGDDELDDAWCSAFAPNPAVIDVLDRRRDDRVLVLFTNNGPLEEEALTRRHPEVFARFDRLFFSHRLRCRKPSPDAFAAVADRLGAPGREIAFVDDSEANVAAARGAGWHALRFHNAAQLREHLDV
jgi:putative hydrolase of the HAD superfamily